MTVSNTGIFLYYLVQEKSVFVKKRTEYSAYFERRCKIRFFVTNFPFFVPFYLSDTPFSIRCKLNGKNQLLCSLDSEIVYGALHVKHVKPYCTQGREGNCTIREYA